MLDLMNRPKHNVMIEDNQNNNDPVITSKSIDPVEILDEGIDHQVNTHLPPIPQTTTGDLHHQGDPGLVDTGTQGVEGQDPVGVRDQQDVDEAHQKRREGHDQRKERTNIDPQKIKGEGILLLHLGNKKLSNKWKKVINPSLPNQLNPRQWDPNK